MTKPLPPDVPLARAPLPSSYVLRTRKPSVIRTGFGSAQDAIGALEREDMLTVLSNGRFGMTQVLTHVLSQTGPAALDLATWNAAGDDLSEIEALLSSGAVRALRFLIDPSFKARKPQFCAELERLFAPDCIRTIPIHAKWAVVRNPEWTMSILSSANLNPTRRLETYLLIPHAGFAEFLIGFADRVFESLGPASNFTTQSVKVLDAVADPQHSEKVAPGTNEEHNKSSASFWHDLPDLTL